ncbi:hypothetical protein [Pseudactinotalea suaedae]|uniref:hypothetical protein n=1 Tax=Pseudactinotalea suaedae TaxID=1524924 RepID=UPI0012E1DDBE|nr:hypothetical protein [Pseudactinotalea suaedae]
MSMALERYAWPTWRTEAVRTLAAVADTLLQGRDDQEAVLRRLSHGQLGLEDLVVSRAQGGGILLRAAEFLDVAHVFIHRASAVPLPSTLDLRCTARFMDDPGDRDSRWIYVLLSTERSSMEIMFGGLRDVESYPVPAPADVTDDPEAAERAEIWARVLQRYKSFSPPSILAPDLHLTLDLIEALGAGDRDDGLSSYSRVTIAEVVAEVALRQGDKAPDDLRAQLVAPQTSD